MRVWITDRWLGIDKATGKRTVRKAMYGRGVRWQVSFYADQPDGTRTLKSKNFERKDDAEAFRTRTAHEARAGAYEPALDTDRRFGSAAEAWWASKRRPNGASLRRYRDALDIWVLPHWAERRRTAITRADVEAWATQLSKGSASHAADRRIRGQGLTPAGLRAIWVPFAATLAHSQRLGWIARNPAVGVELPRVRRATGVFLTYTEVERLLDAVRAVTGRLDDEVMVSLMAFSGLRPGEVVALDVGDVNLATRRISITKTATIDVDRKPIVGEPKHGEVRDVPIAPHLLQPLGELIGVRGPRESLVRSARGNPIDIHNWRYRVWRPAVKAAALPTGDLTPKALRHTAASMAIAAGADVKVVQRMLGHADASMTLNTYADLWPDRLDDVAEAMTAQRELAMRARVTAAGRNHQPSGADHD